MQGCSAYFGAIHEEGGPRVNESKYLTFIVRLGSVLLAVATAWLLFTYALPWLLPFLLAMLTARLLEPIVLYLKRKFKFRRGFSAAICTILVVSCAITAAALIAGATIAKLIELAKNLPSYFSNLPDLVDGLQTKLQSLIMSASPEMRGLVEGALDGIMKQANELPGMFSSKVVSFLSSCASCMPKVIMFVVTYAVGTLFISASYQGVMKFLVRQFPERWQGKIQGMKSDVFGTLGKWARAELILIAVTFVELSVAFMLLRIKSPIPAALLVSIIDALPVFGTGVVLLPWAVLLFIGGNFARGALVAVIWGFITLMRSFLEPKILGDNVGLHPAATLLAIYAGYCISGVKGMIFFPFILIILKQFNDKGYLKIWK